uniref:Uncharacterized protein n=1 Tax=Arundo donax TaxID=35708 RepID=A0A0A9ELQ2_ARUDO
MVTPPKHQQEQASILFACNSPLSHLLQFVSSPQSLIEWVGKHPEHETEAKGHPKRK